jgi:spermidine/putrescine transport system substrate-binding protein
MTSHESAQETLLDDLNPPEGQTRRRFLQSAAALGATVGAGGLLAACGGSGSGGEVVVLNFESYIDPFMVKLWEKTYPHITLRPVPFGADQEAFTKLKAGGTAAYDVVFADGAWPQAYYDAGLTETLDLTKLQGGDDLFPLFREDTSLPWVKSPTEALMYPCEYAPSSMTFNTTVGWKPPQPYSWAALADPQLPSGKVGLEAGPDDALAVAGLATGVPKERVYLMTAAELKRAVDFLRGIKPFRTFSADPELRDAIRKGDVWIGVAPTIGFASKINEEAGKTVAQSVIPKEGAVGYADGPLLVKGAKNRDNAIKYIEFFAANKVARKYIFEQYLGAPCFKSVVASLKAAGGRDAQLIQELHADDPSIAQQIAYVRAPANAKEYAAAWDAVQA